MEKENIRINGLDQKDADFQSREKNFSRAGFATQLDKVAGSSDH